MKSREIIKDKGFWKLLTIVVFSWLLFSLFIINPLLSFVDYHTDYYLSNHLKSFVGGYYYPDSDKIILFENSTIALRHELIHREQTKRDCPKSIFWKEFETYFKQYFVWEKVNLETLDWEND